MCVGAGGEKSEEEAASRRGEVRDRSQPRRRDEHDLSRHILRPRPPGNLETVTGYRKHLSRPPVGEGGDNGVWGDGLTSSA